MDAKKPIPAAVRRAIEWVLLAACYSVFSFALRPAVAYALPQYHACCSECQCGALTDAWKAVLSALWLGMPWCGLLQAAAAALALLLPCRPLVRRTLAHIALAVTIVGHYMYAVLVGLLIATTNPGFLFGRIIFAASIRFFSWRDLVYLLDLLQLGGED